MQLLDAGGLPNLALAGRLQETLGQVGAAVTIPTILAGGLGTAGGAVAGPPGAVAGATAGSALGTEINMRLGLEEDSDINRILSVLLPVGGGFAGRVTRQA